MADAPTQIYTLSANQIRAARLTAEDELTDEEIASECGITRKSLWSWRQRDDFKALVSEQVEAFRNAALTEGFADKRARLKLLNSLTFELARDMAAAPTDDAPKGTYRKEVKIAANGEVVDFVVLDKAKFDTVRGLLDDIAKEMGDRKTINETTHKFDPRREAEAIAREIGKADDPAVVELIHQDLLLSQEAR